MREAVAESERPVMLYSIGKDSSVMLHLARRPSTRRGRRSRCCTSTRRGSSGRCTSSATSMAAELGMELLVHQNPECVAHGHQPVRPRLGGAHRHVEDRGAEAGARPVRLRRSPSAAPAATRRSRGPRSGSSRSAPRSTAGTRSSSGPSCGALYNVRTQPGRDAARVPAVELDRARRVAVHPPRADPDRAALLRRAAAGRRARRHADHGRRRPHAARARARCRAAQRPLPHARLLPAHRRGRERRRHAAPRSSRRCC